MGRSIQCRSFDAYITFAFLWVAHAERAGTNHIYIDESSSGRTQGSDEECSQYAEQWAPFSGPLDQGMYPWSPNVQGNDRDDVLYGTAYTQRRIWEHQHPRDCSGAKFLAMYNWPIGMGALLHFLGRALGLALHLGRILVVADEAYGPESMALWPGPGGMPWHERGLCEGDKSWECWFQPLTHCAVGPDLMALWPSDLSLFRRDNFTWHYVPTMFQHMVRRCSRVKRSMEFYWWHAQAVTYIIRFNSRTRVLLDDLRRKLLHVRHKGSHGLHKLRNIPRGSVAVHVRHGDKVEEVPSVTFDKYYSSAQRLAVGDQTVPVLDPNFADSGRSFNYALDKFAGRSIFLSTEDPEVVHEAVVFAEPGVRRELAWGVAFTRENRTDVDVKTMRQERGYGQATLQSLLNLELSLEADAWVCTLSSNWCQLIDELRMTVARKASAPFINLVHEGFRRGNDCFAFQKCYIYVFR